MTTPVPPQVTLWWGVPPPLLLHTQKRAQFASLSSSTCRLMALSPVASFVAGDAAASDVPATRSTFNRCRSPVLLSIQGILGTVAWGRKCPATHTRGIHSASRRAKPPLGDAVPALKDPFLASRLLRLPNFVRTESANNPPHHILDPSPAMRCIGTLPPLPLGCDQDPDLLRHGTCTSRRAQASRVIPQKRLT